jgi:hypothetical protein
MARGGNGRAMDLDTVVNELYGLLPEDFAAARKARAGEAQAAGNRDLAVAIRQLRRPTTSAWLANLLVRERPEEITALLDLGAAMLKAQTDLAGAEMRRLSQRRQDVVAPLRDAARQLARDHGREVSQSTIRELEETLDAAIADSGARAALASGHLASAMRYSGLGSAELSGVVAKPASNLPRAAARSRGAKAQRIHALRGSAGAETAGRTRRESDATLASAQREAAEHARRRQRALDEIDRCNDAITEAEDRLRSLRKERTRAQADLQKAERALEASERKRRRP